MNMKCLEYEAPKRLSSSEIPRLAVAHVTVNGKKSSSRMLVALKEGTVGIFFGKMCFFRPTAEWLAGAEGEKCPLYAIDPYDRAISAAAKKATIAYLGYASTGGMYVDIRDGKIGRLPAG